MAVFRNGRPTSVPVIHSVNDGDNDADDDDDDDKGSLDEFPLRGDQVTITYDAMFADGNRFDSSRFRNDNKFEFILGKGENTMQYFLCLDLTLFS